VRAGLQAIPEGPIAARSASAAMAGAFAGIFGISVVEQVPRGTQAAAALLMIALASFAILEKRLAILSREEEEADERDLDANEPARPAPTFLGMVRGLFHRKPVLPACAAGMAAIVCSFAATRFFLFAFGNDLGGFPVATLVLLAGCAAGAALTMLLPRAWLRERGAQASSLPPSAFASCSWSGLGCASINSPHDSWNGRKPRFHSSVWSPTPVEPSDLASSSPACCWDSRSPRSLTVFLRIAPAASVGFSKPAPSRLAASLRDCGFSANNFRTPIGREP
jgi:hypothetical protein